MTVPARVQLGRVTGLTVWVLRPCCDFTNAGVSARLNEVLAVSDHLGRGPVQAANRDHCTILLVVRNPHRRSTFVARPIDVDGIPMVGMFGGNYIDSSDSRFREAFGGPVPVHDRFEPSLGLAVEDPSPVVSRIRADLGLLSAGQRAAVVLDLLTSNAWRSE